MDTFEEIAVREQAERDEAAKHMRSRHTPGPWAFDGDWHRIPTIFGSYGVKVASIEKGHQDSVGNARLIKAAPKMLAALQLIASLTDGQVHDIARIAAEAATE